MYEKYSDIEALYEKLHIRVLTDFPNLTLYATECVRFSYQFNNEMSSYIESKELELSANPSLDRRVAVVHNLYSRNNLYLRSVYRLILDGHAAAPSALLRAVYEAVLAQYWLSLCKDTDVETYIGQAPLPPKVPSFNYLKKQLYVVEPSKENRRSNKPPLRDVTEKPHVYEISRKIQCAYNKLSGYIHSNPLTLDAEYNKDMMTGVIELMFTMYLYNTISYSQLYTHLDAAALNMVKEKTDPFIKELLHRTSYKLDMLFPTQPEFAGKLLWYPPEKNTHQC